MKHLSPEQIAMLATSIAIDLANDKTFEEINVIKNIANQVSSVLSTILSQRTIIKFDDKCKDDHIKK